MRRSELSQRLVGFALLTLGLGACQAIAGIEERKLDPDAESAQNNSKQCKDYCTTVMANCTGDNAVYTREELCLGVCAALPPGDENEPEGNTVACRARQAALATEEPAVNCIAAGPGGNGTCGTDCEAYCELFPEICPNDYEYTSTKACLQACSGLIEQPDRLDVTKDQDGDTIECRLVHTSSATADPTTHCPHAPIRPSAPHCTGPADAAPTCEYCKIELAACTGDLTQYESPAQCLAVCAALDPGTNADQTGNTVGCRRYHSFNSTLLPDSHCFHSGPAGDGHCGDHDTGNCDAYCTLLENACPDEFRSRMGSPAACVADCTKLPESGFNSFYTVAKARQSTGLQCRILHAAQAFKDKTACASAVGDDECQ